MVSFVPGFELPPFYCPIDEALHPDFDELRQRCVAWADTTGLYGNDLVERAWGLHGTHADLGFARCCPAAPKERQFILMLWALWVFVGDDNHHHDETTVGLTGRPGGPDRKMAHMVDLGGRLICAADGPDQVLAGGSDTAQRLSRTNAQIVNMMREAGTATQVQRFLERQRQWVLGELWLASVLELGRVPTVEEYTMQRHSASGGLPGLELAAFAQDLRLSDIERNDPVLVTAISAANMVISWDNDLISYPKEAFHGEEKGNMVGVIAHHRNCSPQDAVAEVAAIRDRVMSLFLALHDKLTRSRSSQVRQYADLLRHFIRGHLDWSAAIPRYREITDHRTPPSLNLPPVAMEWTDAPSDTRMTPVDIAPVAWWWDQLRY